MKASAGIIESQLGAVPAALLEALAARADILALSQASHDAVLTPAAPGGLSHAERAALAMRMARHNRDDALARHYESLLAKSGAGADVAALADPAHSPASPRLAAIARHVDILTQAPSVATRADIEALKSAGVSESDIVRVSELAAFVNYQARVIAGLRLLKAVA